MQTYEINTNPTAPRISPKLGKGRNPERRAFMRERLLKAFREIDVPVSGPPYVRFALPKPRMHKFDPLPARARVRTMYERLKLMVGV